MKQNLQEPHKNERVKEVASELKTTVEPNEKRSEPVTQENLNEAFQKYLKNIKPLQPRMYSALLKRNAIMGQNNIVEITFDTELQQEIFIRENRGKAQQFLRNELKNDYISLEIKILEDSSTEKKPIYTAEDKFKYMSEKNPALKDLWQRFKMDLD